MCSKNGFFNFLEGSSNQQLIRDIILMRFINANYLFYDLFIEFGEASESFIEASDTIECIKDLKIAVTICLSVCLFVLILHWRSFAKPFPDATFQHFFKVEFT